MQSFFRPLFHSSTFLRSAVPIAALVALAWSSLAFGGEIHQAARDGDLEKVKTLLNSNPDLVFSKDDSPPGEGYTPLHRAVESGHTDVVELLLTHGADVNAKAGGESTPLHLAAGYGYKDVAKFLLTNKAEVNAMDNGGNTPLHLAAAGGHKDVAELLLAQGPMSMPETTTALRPWNVRRVWPQRRGGITAGQ